MTVTLVLLFASQFLQYFDDTSHAFMTWDSDFNTELTLWFGRPTGTGWELHPQAYVIIAALVLIYLNDFSETRFWTNWGWWLTVALVFACVTPASIRTDGGKLGLICLGLALLAAILNFVQNRARPAA